MFDDLKDIVLKFLTSRFTIIGLVGLLLTSGLVTRLFNLQIVNGESYLDSFQLRIKKEKDIPATRGNIYDCNGNLLAYNELANSVVIEDVFESGSSRHANINETLGRVIDIVEKNGDEVVSDLNIQLSDSGEFEFTVSGSSLLRFLADVYGYSRTDNLKFEEKSSTALDVMNYLGNKFKIGEYTDPQDKSSFVAGRGMSSRRFLQLATLRYNMNLNSFQKYIDTSIAENVSDQTVSDIMENSIDLEGVSIKESTSRKYVDSKYFAQVIGYTGKVSLSELETLRAENPGMNYSGNDTVGKSGIEQTMETVLQGKKGSETVYVDKMGQALETSEYVEPIAGNDVYLTIDKDLTELAYDVLESRLAGILSAKIVNSKEVNIPANSSDLMIPVYDVYYKLFENTVIDVTHFDDPHAGETEKKVKEVFDDKLSSVLLGLRAELTDTKTPYDQLSLEYKNYETYITDSLRNKGVLTGENSEDETYIKYKTDETISLNEYLHYAIMQNWIDISLLNLDSQYSASDEVFINIVDYINEFLTRDVTFHKMLYRYMLASDMVTGRDCCELLLEQKVVSLDDDEMALWKGSAENSYTFIMNRIKKLDLTPAQLNLDPCTGSMVIVDVNTGDVKALVSYPGYDNNRMANGVDAKYYASLRADLSNPLYNYATQQKTAPGSTYKPMSATAGLMEGVISTASEITCTGIFEKISPPAKCWIYPSAHGTLDVSGGITNSCNGFFYEVGYRLGNNGNGYDSDMGLERLAKYADMYGLTDKSGVEIEENEPSVSDQDAVRSAIGQGTNSYTTTQLARYITSVANNGTTYNLTLIDKTTDSAGNLLEDYSASVRNTMDSIPTEYWNAIHKGMRGVVESRSDYKDMKVEIAGKTGTAQERKDRANHALFVSYAPYSNPEISITTRVAYGYSSTYAAKITHDVYQYYFGEKTREELLGGEVEQVSGGTNDD
ncbi:penicillin-binding transpeptidase domain-containing protein [Butyrivibrio sp. MC2013]|uniref:penicillin-binding transpeptidase domain-containing protein n=1 Tax=Butyrivibrio sp. MC2013 TaxID=1280686 RepID=UPI00041BB4E6|nr:penicillin-binding transpeptidase domain-containing protein [Butyrivibrio sp. MC2013]